MGAINRSAAVVIPRKPFWEWVEGVLGEDDPRLCREDLSREPSFFLLPETIREVEVVIRQNWRLIFEEELSSWIQDEDSWPRERTLKMFKEWFEVHASTLVVDLVDDCLLDQDVLDAL